MVACLVKLDEGRWGAVGHCAVDYDVVADEGLDGVVPPGRREVALGCDSIDKIPNTSQIQCPHRQICYVKGKYFSVN